MNRIGMTVEARHSEQELAEVKNLPEMRFFTTFGVTTLIVTPMVSKTCGDGETP
ncbi:hypothetical protein MMU07_07400 [Aquiflexum sp. LQ15W]|uniref:hypothetical protein n=1 Tax=Cognataquiflexum nitidum TaxID=2922272 RepID=UPI001F1366EB|nr:hypothetical protein [Cognataquiflexum nitidum]MCH6199396.1 hypothetical protein [Cognataquiflexum nitidum]